MKIAITGKGGVGKTTVVALMARVLRDQGRKVLLVDADPDMNLATVLGIGQSVAITPIAELKELIAERTGTEGDEAAPLFRMNPRVDDIPGQYCVEHEGLKLIVMGTIRKGGAGCACAENAFLKALLSHLILARDEWVLVDMEAGIEHLGRGTAMAVDQMIVVVEPSQTSVATAQRIHKLSRDIGLRRIAVVGNKIATPQQWQFILENTRDLPALGFISMCGEIKTVDMGRTPLLQLQGTMLSEVSQIITKFTADAAVA